MALDMDNLSGLAGEVIGQVRDFEDSWGWPQVKVTGRVLRADDPEWRQHVFDVQSNRPESKATREAVNDRIFYNIAPRGFRRKAKTESEAHNAMLRRVAENEKLLTEVMSLRDQKGGIAAMLCKELRINGESVLTRTVDGQKVNYDLSTVEGRLAILDHEFWEFEQDGEKVEMAVPIYRMNGDGPALDDAGEPVRNTVGGWNLGDGLAHLIREAAEETEKFVRARKADALEQSGSISTGPSGSGSRSPSAGDAS